MAHFAQIENGTVVDVLVVKNEVITDADGVEQEAIGVQFMQDTFGGGEWVQTSYSGAFRGKYAGKGDLWDGMNFVSPGAL